ncbi:hypothetical protein OG921_20750 [Aldersonia sp. NBC_00410]|uniref:hypothetical protein n=1 Tax=Aldersonia sp. NBC_00410 TaxID=2975954 RepID=UPI002251A888|nr:hypothetical protein [Aldersonia sp. NBC_00410]MCX5045599.1 hypothetical protein [Aldersonia sp. NBC_00410]
MSVAVEVSALPDGKTLLRAGVAAVVLAVVASALAPMIGVAGAAAGPDPRAVAAASWCAALLMLTVAGLAIFAAIRGCAAATGGLLVGFGAVCAALLVFDAGLLRRPIDSNRFELLRPLSAADLTLSGGAWLVIAGHLAGVLAGGIGLALLHRVTLRDGYGDSVDPDLSGRPIGVRLGPWFAGTSVAIAFAFAIALIPAAWTATDPVLVVHPFVESSASTIAGTVTLGLVVLIGTGLALASPEAWTAAGLLTGLGLTACAFAAARLGASADPGLSPTPAALVAVLAAAALVLVGAAIPPLVARRDRRALERDDPQTTLRGRKSLSTFVIHALAGAMGVLTAVLVAVGALVPALVVPAGRTAPEVLADGPALVAALGLAATCVWLFFSEFAATVRPAVVPIAAAAALGATGVTQAALDGVRIPGIEIGVGGVFAMIGVLAAAATAVLVGFAGAAERDEIDLADLPDRDPTLLAVGGAGAVSATVALALPIHRGATSFDLPWGWDTWGHAQLAAVLIGAAVVAAGARPARAIALLTGAALAVLGYLLWWPLTGESPGPGVPFAVVAIVAFAVAALLCGRRDAAAGRRT